MKKEHLALGIGGAIGGAIALKILTRAKSVSFDNFEENVPHADHSNFAEVDGATVHYQEFGDASNPTLILIHGYTSSTNVWKTVTPMFATRGFHVIAIDLLGYGYSDKPAWFDYRIQSQARFVMRFMNVLGIGRATLIGSSYGGAVAAMATLDYPERVEKLVLVSAVSNDEATSHPLLKIVGLPGIGEALIPFFVDSKAFQKHRMKTSFSAANQDLVSDERVKSVQRPLSAKDGHNSILQTARNWDANQIEEDAHLINQPTLLVWGEEDQVIPIRNGYKLHQEILNSRFVVLKNCGHIPMEEAPEDFVEITTTFCRDQKGRFELEENEQMKLETFD